jgi:23S rRNA (guanosine2251-2'-O)-methyltransferase
MRNNNFTETSKKNQLIYGIHSLNEAIESGKQIEKIFVQKNLVGQLSSQLKNKLKENNLEYKVVPEEYLNKITRQNHQGIVAYISPIEYHHVEDVIFQLFENGSTPFILVLDRITDVRNFGAICRTAECVGVHAIVVPFKGSSAINEDAIKTSAGALNHIKLCKSPNLKYTLNYLSQSGLDIVAVTEKANDYYTSYNFTKPIALILGSEEDGISPEYLKMCNQKVKIPVVGHTQSLNVSVATAVVLYETLRQRTMF